MRNVLVIVLALLPALQLHSQSWISEKKMPGAFSIVANGIASAIYVDVNDHAVVVKAAALLHNDIELVTGKKAKIINQYSSSKNIILIGTIGQSRVIDQLIDEKKILVDSIKNKWEGYQVQVVKNPLPGILNALVITGSDRRGTAYGVLELSKQMGISPWYYWADVPAKKKSEVYYVAGLKHDAPAVKYRGIFINDEAPALSRWSNKTFGGFNHVFYGKVFELILRMKGNYLWPAMWGSAFYDDDSLNAKTADDYAIVMGTSHHEPLGRAHDEWRRYGEGKWNYDSNAVKLKSFWRGGVERMKANEKIVSVGMRGDGDEPMTEGTAIALLEEIVTDQREIISDVTKKPASETPQLWALYKEVQEYYDKGMRVPDDVTLLLCDDNWGNIRKLPKVEDNRDGGYGIYYHFDYVGGPRNYKWINTNQIERTWEQMHLAYEHGVNKIWIVNVGDIKPMEFPTQFFLDYAWKPSLYNASDLPKYYEQWAENTFGAKHAKSIAQIIAGYTKYNSRRKPELLSPDTYSLTNYDEANRIVSDYNTLLTKAEGINKVIPKIYRDAFYQLVLHPVKASANLNELYVTVAKNRKHAKQNHPLTNAMADKAKQLYLKDSLISKFYNDTLADGKWKHMMDQTHIGYTYWQQPEKNVMPRVEYIDAAVEVAEDKSPHNLEKMKPAGFGKKVIPTTFFQQNGYVSIEAENYTKSVNSNGIQWTIIPNLGKTLSGITPFPVTSKSQQPVGNNPRLEYQIWLTDTGSVKVHVYLSPTLPFHSNALRYAISINDETPQVVNMHAGYNEGLWNKWVAENIVIKVSEHKIKATGWNTIKFWMVDAGVVLQKIVVDAGGLKSSYLGPVETRIK